MIADFVTLVDLLICTVPEFDGFRKFAALIDQPALGYGVD